MPAVESPILQTVSSLSDPKPSSSYPGNGSGSGYRGNGQHFCSQGQTLERMQRAMAQISEDLKEIRVSEGLQLKALNDAVARVLEEIIIIGHRVGKVGNDPTSESEATGLTKAVIHNTKRVNELEHRLDSAFDSIHEIKLEEESSGIHDLEQLQQKYQAAKQQIQRNEREEKKRQEAWRSTVVKILVLLAAGGGGAEALRHILDLLK